MSFPFAEVERSIEGIRSKLNCPPDESLQKEYDAGLHPNLLAYTQTQPVNASRRALEKYVVGASSYLHQPSHYYDIFGACRSVIIIQLLEAALEMLDRRRVNGLAARVGRLLRANDFDSFDAAAFEIITAARYAEVANVNRIEFIDEQPPDKTPDFVISINGVDSFIECKKAARVKEHSKTIRGAVGNLLNGVIAEFRKRGISASVEVVFNCDPLMVKHAALLEASMAALGEHTTIITSQFTVKAARLPNYESKEYILHPSPLFSWNRYKYRVRGEWFGLVHQVVGIPRRTLLPKHLRGGMSTWLGTIDWDAAIKWKIGEGNIMEKYRRFAFDGLFHGMDQINGEGLNSTVHLWLESDHHLGGRRDALLNFYNRLAQSNRQPVGWIVINETLFEVSPKGHPDLIEHAHIISGPTASRPHPLVSGVFGEEVPVQEIGEFGVGHQLKDIDEE